MRIVRIGEAERLHRAVAQRLAARARPSPRSAGSRRNRASRLPIRGTTVLSPASSASTKAVVLLARQRAVDVVGAGAAGAGLVVARLEPGDRHVDRVAMHDRRDRVEEGERVLAGEAARSASASAGEVRGPVATMTLSQSAGGSGDLLAPRSRSADARSSAAVTAAEKPSRSTASAPPAGTWWASAARMISEPSRRISSCSRPTALVSRSSERNELEQTSSASPSVLCAAVVRTRPHLVQHDRHAAARRSARPPRSRRARRR